MEICYTCFLTPFGWSGIVKGSAGILRIFLPEPEKRALEDKMQSHYPLFSVYEPDAFSREVEALSTYFSGGGLYFPFKLDLSGATAFQKQVWKAVQGIPYGQVRTYQWISRRIKNPGSMRAVGNALGRNPAPIAIPCHRVIRTDGGLGGFSAIMGTSLKQALLKLEGVIFDNSIL